MSLPIISAVSVSMADSFDLGRALRNNFQNAKAANGIYHAQYICSDHGTHYFLVCVFDPDEKDWNTAWLTLWLSADGVWCADYPDPIPIETHSTYERAVLHWNAAVKESRALVGDGNSDPRNALYQRFNSIG